MQNNLLLNSSKLNCKLLLSKSFDARSDVIKFLSAFLNSEFELSTDESREVDKFQLLKVPVLIEANENIFHSGLCICCRIVLQKSIDIDPELSYSLMGFKSNLLKSYESLCDWRFTFENEFPMILSEFSHECTNNLPQLVALMERINQRFSEPATIFNAAGLAKKLIKQSKIFLYRDFDSETEKFDSNWFLNSESCKSILELNLVPNIFCSGVDATIIDLLLFAYLTRICSLGDFKLSSYRELHRWMVLMLLKFRKLLERTGTDISDLEKALDFKQEDLQFNFFIPKTDVNFVRNPDQVNQGRWLPRGLTKTDLISISKRTLGNPNSQPHPNLHWMDSFVWSDLPDFADVSKFVPEKRAERKREQILNIVAACQLVSKPGSVIVDFCSGGGHVGLLLAYLLPDCEIILLDNKLESLHEAQKRLKSGLLRNVTMLHCSIEQFEGHFDIGVSLHACGPSTDLVLSMCYKKRASFVICPCCYGNIRFAENFQYPRSTYFKSNDVKTEEFYLLTKGADNSTNVQQRNDCMNFVDWDRLEEAKDLGYKYTVMTKLVPESCSPKNNLIIASPYDLL